MKIRTNFVTNSSSYSSAEIKIDNPVLLEILKKYNEMGAFEGTHMRSNCFGVKAKKGKKEVALFYYEPEQADIFFAPRSVEDIIGCLLRAMAEDEGELEFDYPESYPAFKAFKAELSERKKEINDNFVEVSWEAHNNSSGEFEPEEGKPTEWIYKYHK